MKPPKDTYAQQVSAASVRKQRPPTAPFRERKSSSFIGLRSETAVRRHLSRHFELKKRQPPLSGFENFSKLSPLHKSLQNTLKVIIEIVVKEL